MKPASFLTILILAITALSCKKSTKNNNMNNSCRIVATYDTIIESTGKITRSSRMISYNKDGKITSVLNVDSLTSTTRTFTYGENYLVRTTDAVHAAIDTIYLNENGLPQEIFTYQPGAFTVDEVYAYNGKELQTRSLVQSYSNYNSIYFYKFTFTNGDNTSVTGSGGGVTNYTYYPDKTASEGDPTSFYYLTTYGIPVIVNTHLIKSQESPGYRIDYTYTFDNTGKIATVVNTNPEYIGKTTYVYDCSQ